MKGNEWVMWFLVWVTWFVVFSLICGQEREVCVKDVLGPNDDNLFLTRLVAATNKACS